MMNWVVAAVVKVKAATVLAVDTIQFPKGLYWFLKIKALPNMPRPKERFRIFFRRLTRALTSGVDGLYLGDECI